MEPKKGKLLTKSQIQSCDVMICIENKLSNHLSMFPLSDGDLKALN